MAMSVFHSKQTLVLCQVIDRFGQIDIALRHPARVVAGQAEVDTVPHAGELRVVIDLLRMQRDATEEAERLAEILELEAAHQRLAALLESPAIGSVHRD